MIQISKKGCLFIGSGKKKTPDQKNSTAISRLLMAKSPSHPRHRAFWKVTFLFYRCIFLVASVTRRAEQEFTVSPEIDLVTNDALMENIVSSIFIDDTEENDTEEASPTDSLSLNIEEDKMLSNEDLCNYPIKLTQQQLRLLNSLSNRLTLLYNDVEKAGVPLHFLQPHKTALQRMIAASREVQFKIQAFSRKHRPVDSAAITPDSSVFADAQAVEKEKERLQGQLDALNEKLMFFSSEYQRITELYMQERNRKQADTVEGL